MDILFYTNIPTPYRTYFYNKLFEHFPRFQVWYQRDNAPYRSWKLEDFKMMHPHFNGNGVYFKIRGFHFFSSIRLIVKLLSSRPKLIILGLGWNDIDALIIIFLKKVGVLKCQICFWSEANHLTLGAKNDYLLKRIIRAFIYNRLELHIRSGRMTEITLNKWGVKQQNFIRLPNCIDEGVFSKKHERKQDANSIVILIAARIIERLKGIINFLDAIPIEIYSKIVIKIAGDGEDMLLLRDYINNRKIFSSVVLLGEIQPEMLSSEMSRADIFCLPSFSDPSPLVITEALCAGLPLLISDQCGNHYESVRYGHNGRIFNPYNKLDILEALEYMICNRKRLIEMGANSRMIYYNEIAATKIINDFLTDISEKCDIK